MHPRTALAILAVLFGTTAIAAEEPDAERKRRQLRTLRLEILDPSSERVIRSLKQLGCMGEDAKSAVPEIEKLLKHKKEEIRDAAIDALVRIGTVDQAVTLLRDEMKNREQPYAEVAAERLARLGPLARDAIPDLEAKLKSNSPSWRIGSALALARIQAGHKEAIESLIQEVSDGVEYRPYYAAKALGDIGPTAKAALPALRELARTGTDAAYRPIVEKAIARIEAQK